MWSSKVVTYDINESVSADLDVVSRSDWIHEILDEHRRTTRLTSVDSENVVVLSEHDGTGA